ncbi:hypothetical protein CEXT_653151 [Caerostris extrusa]|uniref:Uncharacterized protein n=1 Tax=Caerostris extrusa TaxID=172846 RepID=A0AAV4R5N4_CAEEX|nr:hypothetical protein CEXT_653151 [Caerostris extrusa]
MKSDHELLWVGERCADGISIKRGFERDCLLHADNRPWGLRAGFYDSTRMVLRLVQEGSVRREEGFYCFSGRGGMLSTRTIYFP